MTSLAAAVVLAVALVGVTGCGKPDDGPPAAAVSRAASPRSQLTTPARPQVPPSPQASATAERSSSSSLSSSSAVSGSAAGTASGSGSAQTPAVVASPVFVGEACDPATDTEPGAAVNGLTLYCQPEPTGVSRWTSQSPPPQEAARPERGADCDPDDVGKVVPDASGRLVACLPDPAGGMRWSDVS